MFKKLIKRISQYSIYGLDHLIPKNKNYWAFPVCFLSHDISCNLRAVFEEVKNDRLIKKIILIRSKPILLSGENIVYEKLNSLKGLILLMQSGVIFLRHAVFANVEYNLSHKKHCFVNLWHGIPLKKIGLAGSGTVSSRRGIKLFLREHEKYSVVISSSDIDRMAMTSAFTPTLYNNVYVTGLPRNDFILKEVCDLPPDFSRELFEIASLKGDKKLILYAPTYRNGQESSGYKLSEQDLKKLKNFLKKNNAILGIREHMADRAHCFSKQLDSTDYLDMNKYVNIEMIYRNADLLITDYSSCFIDFMLTNKPIVNFSYDYERYMNQERGFFYEMSSVFPSELSMDFDSMLESLQYHLNSESRSTHYQNCKKLFFKFTDEYSSKRVVEITKNKIQ